MVQAGCNFNHIEKSHRQIYPPRRSPNCRKSLKLILIRARLIVVTASTRTYRFIYARGLTADSDHSLISLFFGMLQELTIFGQSTEGTATNASSALRLPRYQPLVLVALAICAGIAVDQHFDWKFSTWLIVLCFGSLVWLVSIVGWRSIKGSIGHSQEVATSKEKGTNANAIQQVASISMLILIATLASMWHHARWNWFDADEVGLLVVDRNDSLPVCVEGKLVTEPRWITPKDSDDGFNYRKGEIRTRVEIKLSRIQNRGAWQHLSGSVDLMIQGRWEAGKAGDQVRVYGILVGYSPPSNPGQVDFQQQHRAKQKLAALHVHQPDCVFLITHSRPWIGNVRSQMRTRLDQLAWDYLTPDQAAFASAIMLGNREQLSPERRERFLRTGTAHLLAISGLHVGILASSFFLLLRLGWLNRRQCLWATVLFVLGYAWLVEFRPPVMRATVLIVVFSLGRLFGQRGYGFNLLALAAIIVLVFNPRDLFNLGAQLSFLAVGTLISAQVWIFPPPSCDPLQRLIANTRPWPIKVLRGIGRAVRTAYLASIFIWLAAMPLVAYHFHVVAPVGMVINPLLLIPLAFALYSGLVVMAVGEWLPPLAGLAGWICQTSLNGVERLIERAALWPYSHFMTCGPSWLALVIFYVGLFWLATFPPTRLRLSRLLLIIGLWMIVGWWGVDRLSQQIQAWGHPKLTCTIIDVGHGNSVLLEMPDGKRILYDAGSFGSASYGYNNISAVFWFKRINHLDQVIISHPDLDHYNSLAELSQRFTIDELVVTRQTASSSSPALRNLLNRLAAMDVPTRIVAADDRQDMVGANGPPIHELITILSPPATGTHGNDNSDSLVLAIEYQGVRILLTGDIEGPGLTSLIEKPVLPFDLVMAPHHGSFNSDPSAFMEWSQPKIVAISGASKRIRENAAEVFGRNQRIVVRTDRHGAIEYSIHGETESLKIWNQGHWKVVELSRD